MSHKWIEYVCSAVGFFLCILDLVCMRRNCWFNCLDLSTCSWLKLRLALSFNFGQICFFLFQYTEGKHVQSIISLLFYIIFLAFDFCLFCVVIRFFIPATTANDLRLRRIFYSRFYPLHLFSYLNS